MGEFLRQFCKWLINGPTLDRVARWRLLHFIGIAVLLISLQPMVMLDVTFLFSFDLGLLTEISAVLFVLAVRDRGRTLLHLVRYARSPLHPIFRRGFARARRSVGRVLKLPKASDEDGVDDWVFA